MRINDIGFQTAKKRRLQQPGLQALLAQSIGELPHKGKDTFIDIPVAVTQRLFDEGSALTTLLNKALCQIVNNFDNDPRIQRIYNLDDHLKSLVKICNATPYHIGLYRPDFLIDQDGQLKLCEIGCRYPLNGWMLSGYLHKAMREISNEGGENANSIIEAITDALASRLPDNAHIFLVHDNEPGSEIFYLLEELRHRGVSYQSVKPASLRAANGKLSNDEVEADFALLELDREELKLIDQQVLMQLVRSNNYLNDIRSLILVHDKRVLAVLDDDGIMSDYLSIDEYSKLKPYLIRSISTSSPAHIDQLMHTQEAWILKRASGGRGIGALLNKECRTEEWQTTLLNHSDEYMAQQWVSQARFPAPYVAADDDHNKDNDEPIYLVGMLLCENDHFHGPGLFRGSSQSIVNVHEGRSAIFPCVLANESP